MQVLPLGLEWSHNLDMRSLTLERWIIISLVVFASGDVSLPPGFEKRYIQSGT